jgi:hypothetical protein
MPLFLIERNYAEQLEVTPDGFLKRPRTADQIRSFNEEMGCSWVFSFLSADKRKSYCVYEAPNAEVLREHARRADIPADAIIELAGVIRPDLMVGPRP